MNGWNAVPKRTKHRFFLPTCTSKLRFAIAVPNGYEVTKSVHIKLTGNTTQTLQRVELRERSITNGRNN
jgi:hypothetical protein|tara:strand:+ start:3311 stop:3517 length:207 start_codon:yes stop_codon:yes gene_type:complete